MKRDCLGGDLSAAERIAVIDAATVYEFDDRFIAPRNGFAGADDYYAQCMALQFLDEVRVPTLVLHADDDPWIPVACYRRYDWSRNANLTLLLVRGGGHAGFHGLGDSVPWHDRCLGRSFGAISGS